MMKKLNILIILGALSVTILYITAGAPSIPGIPPVLETLRERADLKSFVPYNQMTSEEKITMYQTMAGTSPETYNFSVETAGARLGYVGIVFAGLWLVIGLPFYIGSKIYDYVKKRKNSEEGGKKK